MGQELVATQRMLPAVAASTMLLGKTRPVNGRTFTAVAGTTVDAAPQDARVLQANNWFNVGGKDCVGVGITAQRPAASTIAAGNIYADTTTGNLIVWDGATWRNPVTGAAV